MGNLQQPREAILYNSFGEANYNLYNDFFANPAAPLSPGNTVNLLLVDHGILLTREMLETYGYFTSSKPPATLICNKQGKYQNIQIELNPECPCEDCDYNYGVTVREILQKPGVFDNMFGDFRFYGGKLERIECTYGLINDSYRVTMENDIITQCMDDEDGPAYATRMYVINDNLANTTTLVHTSSAGVATTITQLNAHTAQQLVTTILGAGISGLVAYVASKTGGTTDYVVIQMGLQDPTATISISAGATQIARRITFVNKSYSRKFEVKYDDGFATSHFHFFWNITQPDWTDEDEFVIYVNDTSFLVTNYTDLAGAIAAIIADTIDVAVTFTGTDAGGHIFISDDYLMDVDQMDVVWDACTLDSDWTITGFGITPDGAYEYLPTEEVKALFVNMGHHGHLSHVVSTTELPIEGQEYCKITYKYSGEIYSQHGAGHLDGFVKWLDIYLPKDCDVFNTLPWSIFLTNNVIGP